MSGAELLFLRTGGAWALQELGCNCFICGEMRKRGEQRRRTAVALKGADTLLVDCGPDIASQLQDNGVGRPDAVLITHGHGDHFLGLDELVSFRRTTPTITRASKGPWAASIDGRRSAGLTSSTSVTGTRSPATRPTPCPRSTHRRIP